jgi:hypothetical protein
MCASLAKSYLAVGSGCTKGASFCTSNPQIGLPNAEWFTNSKSTWLISRHLVYWIQHSYRLFDINPANKVQTRHSGVCRMRHKRQIHVAYSHQYAEGFGAITGGLTDFSPPTGGFFLDHDQRNTLSSGFDLDLPGRTWATAISIMVRALPTTAGQLIFPGTRQWIWLWGRTSVSAYRFPWRHNNRIANAAIAQRYMNRRLFCFCCHNLAPL